MTTQPQAYDWSLAAGRKYMLSRNAAALSRLNLQHYIWKDSFSYLLHPSIPLSQSTVLADIATGTGIWLVDLARQLPRMQMDGFDVDLEQAGHAYWLPENVRLRVWDVFEEPEEELCGRYDVVHVRLLVLVVPEMDLREVVRRVVRLLKPGGYVQWDELNVRDVCVRRVPVPVSEDEGGDETPGTPGLDTLRAMSYANGKYDWTHTIPDMLRGNGLEEIETKHFDDRPEMLKVVHENNMLIMEEFALKLVAAEQREAAEKFFKNIDMANAEHVRTGAALSFPRFVTVFRKPS